MQSKIPVYPSNAKTAQERGELDSGARASVRIVRARAEPMSLSGKISTGCT